MRLSVVIPALNEAANIGRAVESAWQAGADEVIVVDGGSTDETAEIAASMNCRLLHSERGRARQQNAGAKQATGDVLLFLHADCWLGSPEIGAQIAMALPPTPDPSPRRVEERKNDVVFGAFRQRIDAAGSGYRWLEWGNATRVRWRGLPYGDQAIFVRREVFWQLGGFAEVPLMEDVMLSERLRKLAWPVLLPGPVMVSPRRWQKQGIAGQTLRNWWLLARYRLGTPPERLAPHYRAHTEES